MIRGTRSSRARRALGVSVLALGLSLAGRVPAARSAEAEGLRIWSMQVHGGAFTLTEGNGVSPMAGVRYCKHYTPQFYGGMLVGWTGKSSSVAQPTSDPANPGPRIELARVNAQLVPVMGFVQLNLTHRTRIVPLLGIGAGYEWLAFRVQDLRTGGESRPTYGNWAWESWGGLAVRLTDIWRMNTEVYYNGGALQRDVTDSSGHRWIEAVHVNGVGARVGFDMNFW